MKIETAEKKAFNYMRKHYPLLRTGLISYFTDIIVLTYEGFKYDEEFKNDTDRLQYSIEINTNEEYHEIIKDYDNVLKEEEQKECQKNYVNRMIKWNLGVK